ncbi:MAG: TRAP transporter substrate-binding protein [Oscillospiraceae bacterium]|jgi:tripartite ATP-independent transporter DctP family solute receptor|nr:TRAP transporter substrate-binding protein [Oscillospiraceae bacterium]
MKKLLTLALSLLLVCALAAVASAEVTLKLSEVHAEGYPTALADHEFARLVEEKTEGRVKIEVYTNGSLYADEPTSIEALQIGDLGFARVSASPVGAFVPSINAIQMPYLYNNAEHMWKVLDGEIGQAMLAGIQSSGSGLIGLCYYDAGSRSFYLTKEVHAVADMQGLKIRTQGNPMMIRMAELLTGIPGVTGIGPGEVYSAIQNGVVDGAENNWPTYQNMSDYEVAKFYILDSHTRVPEILLASEAALKAIDPEDLEIIKQVAKDTQEFEKAAWAAKEKESEAIVRAAGTTVVELTTEAYKGFQDAMAPLYEEFGKDYADVIEQIRTTDQ